MCKSKAYSCTVHESHKPITCTLSLTPYAHYRNVVQQITFSFESWPFPTHQFFIHRNIRCHATQCNQCQYTLTHIPERRHVGISFLTLPVSEWGCYAMSTSKAIFTTRTWRTLKPCPFIASSVHNRVPGDYSIWYLKGIDVIKRKRETRIIDHSFTRSGKGSLYLQSHKHGCKHQGLQVNPSWGTLE